MNRSTPALAPQPASQAKSQPLDYSTADSVKGSDGFDSSRRTSRLSHITRRAKYVTRFIYWSIRHGSTKHAGWVCNYEGLWW
jgi:hypothetical protein